MSKRGKPMKMVEVRWVDCVALHHGWRSPAHYKAKATSVMRRMVTIGLLVSETKEAVLVAHSGMVGNGNVDHCMSIPRGQIVKMKRLR